jgi:predicted Zn finger-like uncharacterized protein
MQIQCPACHARAQLPDSKEGAKVRCGECGRVYVAVVAGSRARRGASRSNPGLLIGVGTAVLGALGLLYLKNAGGAPAETARVETNEPAPKRVESTGWTAPAVQAAAGVHRAAFGARPDGLTFMLDAPRIWAAEQAKAAAEGGAAAATPADYARLPAPEREAFVHRVAETLIQGADKELVADWEPFDGEVIQKTDVEATVRVAVKSRAQPGEQRFVEWQLALVDGRWKAWGWKRWLTPEEEKAARKAPPSTPGVTRVTLSDGSRVIEREPEPLGHLETTSPELRERIDRLYATLIDLSLTSEASQAARELERIGKPAVPILLTGLYEIPLDTIEQGIQVNLIDQVLRGISGRSFGYTPQEIVASGRNANNEHRRSAIKQWFAWWFANQDTFEQEKARQREAAGAAEGKLQLTEREKRLLERGDG